MDAVSQHLRQLRNDFFQVRLETQQCKAELRALEARATALKAEEHEKLHMLAAQDNFIVQKSSELYLLDQQLEQKRKELAIASEAIASLKVVHSEMTRYTVELDETLAGNVRSWQRCTTCIQTWWSIRMSCNRTFVRHRTLS